MAVKIIHLPLLSEDASSRIEELQMLETLFHHRCIRCYVLFISIDNIGLLVTSLVDMSLKIATSLFHSDGWIESFETKCLLIFDPRENISNASKSMD